MSPIVVLTQHNDNGRTGANLQEVVLNTSNVNPQKFGKLFSYSVQGDVYAQPLYVSKDAFPNGGTHNVVYVATMHNMVYALVADDPNPATNTLWQKALEPSIPLPDPNIGPPSYADITGRDDQGHPLPREVGILSTPVISLPHNAIYVVTASKDPSKTDPSAYSHHLHALDLTTGADKFGGPVQISGSVHGTVKGSVNGTITFTSNFQIQRPALLLANDTIYMAFAAYGDRRPYHGWMFAYSASTLHQVAVFNTTPNGEAGGIWQAGQGPTADEKNNIYILTGNGDFNPDGSALSDCFVKLGPNLTVLDWFSPFNNDKLNFFDVDVGSSGFLLLPNTNLLLGGGKEGKFFLMQRNHLGHFDKTTQNGQIVQNFYIKKPDLAHPDQGDDNYYASTADPKRSHHIHGGPVYWNGPQGRWVYVWTENDVLKAFALLPNGMFQTTTTPKPVPNWPGGDPLLGIPSSQSSDPGLGGIAGKSPGMPGGMLSISANGNTPGSGIVWVSHPLKANANQMIVAGIVRAYDASDLSNELWNSKVNKNDDIGNFAKFCPPTIANGRVYMASFSNKVVVYGRL